MNAAFSLAIYMGVLLEEFFRMQLHKEWTMQQQSEWQVIIIYQKMHDYD